MPSHTTSSALVSLYLDGDQAPWNYSAWQKRTGVRNGLFSQDDSQLPPRWTRADCESVSSYFSQYANVVGEDARIKFSSSRTGAVVPGRDFWRSWVTSNWAKWKIHSAIADLLIAKDIHPVALYQKNTDLKNKQVSNSYLPLILDDIGASLFGPEALDSKGQLPYTLRGPTQQLAQRTWSTLTKQISRSKQKFASLEAAARVAFEDLDRDKLTKGKISTVIRAVQRWKTIAELFDDPDTLAKIDQMDEELRRLMEGLGAKVKARAPKVVKEVAQPKRLCNVENASLTQLAKQGDVDDIINLYADYFETEPTAGWEPIIDTQPKISIPFGVPADESALDPGVEVESNMKPEALCHNLGFKNGLPILFNQYRHVLGLTAWDPKFQHLFTETDPKKRSPHLKPLALHWHQMAGVHAIVRNIFSAQPSANHIPGVLLADEVGLGKTFQAGALIAFLSDLAFRQQKNLPPPPIIVQNPYLGEIKSLPMLPHLIVVPGTIIGQWESELRSIFKPGTVDILVYESGKDAQEKFWDSTSAFSKSLHSVNRIVITSHSALMTDFSKLHLTKSPSRGKLPWAPRTRLALFDRLAPKTLFGQKWLSVTLDESHEFRNNTKHAAALAVVELCRVRLIATATPLLTSNQDTAAMGRLCGIPHFLSDAAYVEEKQDTADLRRAKAEVFETAEDAEAELDLPSEGYDDDNENGDGAAGPRKEAMENPLRLCQVAISVRHQSQFEGRIIRRTINSLDYKGTPILPLPECETILGVVELTEREKEIITVLSDDVREDVSNANGSRKISSKHFYTAYRVASAFAQESKGPPPRFSSLQEWEAHKSTKMDVVAKVIVHTLSSDKAPPVKFVDGVPVFPPVPALLPGEVPRNKVAVFQEFASLGRVLRNVFDLYQIKYVYIDGQASYEKRSQIIHQFKTDPAIRTLIFTRVGATGLNLTDANTLLFVDQTWSAQDERQILGRIYRQPQNKKVYCYHILAKDTADILLSSHARRKRDMMEAFLSKKRGQELYDLFSGRVLVDEEDEIEDADEPKKKARSKKSKAKKETNSKKVDKVIEQVEPNDEEPVDMSIDDPQSAPSPSSHFSSGAGGTTSSGYPTELEKDNDISMLSTASSNVSITGHRSPSPEEITPPPPTYSRRSTFLIKTPTSERARKRPREDSQPPSNRRREQSSPGPATRSFFLSPSPRPIDDSPPASESPLPRGQGGKMFVPLFPDVAPPANRPRYHSPPQVPNGGSLFTPPQPHKVSRPPPHIHVGSTHRHPQAISNSQRTSSGVQRPQTSKNPLSQQQSRERPSHPPSLDKHPQAASALQRNTLPHAAPQQSRPRQMLPSSFDKHPQVVAALQRNSLAAKQVPPSFEKHPQVISAPQRTQSQPSASSSTAHTNAAHFEGASQPTNSQSQRQARAESNLQKFNHSHPALQTFMRPAASSHHTKDRDGVPPPLSAAIRKNQGASRQSKKGI